MINWLTRLFRKKDKVETFNGCNLCYDSGVVGLTMQNRHFSGGEYYRKCPNGCSLTEYGRGKLWQNNPLHLEGE